MDKTSFFKPQFKLSFLLNWVPGRVELLDVGDAEPLDKLPPDVALESVAEEAPDAVVLVPRRLGGGQQVAAHLADVDRRLQMWKLS